MADSVAEKYQSGETALVVKMPEVERLVGQWRSRYDPAAAAGVPAHVTVFYPFLRYGLIDDRVADDLEKIANARPIFDVTFARSGRLPNLLYLEPSPDRPFIDLTSAVMRRWPQISPYRGRHPHNVPHLTVAVGQDAAVLAEIEADLIGQLPITAPVEAIQLVVFEGRQWRDDMLFGLQKQLKGY